MGSKHFLTAAVLAGLAIAAAQAQGEGAAVPAAPAARGEALDWSAWASPVGARAAAEAVPAALEPAAPNAEIDVVDAHWMALTMWGEGRGEGEDGMRAIGHVIHNRWREGRGGGFVTETVSEAWQFSAWNQGDPNRQAMLDIHTLREGSAGHRQWLAAKRIAAEILAGRSQDPTGGALFYHTTAVHPAWSRGVEPVTQIGDHLFFTAVR